MPADLSYTVLISYGVGHVFNDLCASMWFTYLLIFLLYVERFSDTLAGAALLIGQVADGISTPIVGLFSDQRTNLWICKYGRRKIWHLVGTACVVISFPFIFSPCYGCKEFTSTEQLLYYSSFIILFQFGWASVQISHLSLVPELTPNSHARTSLLAVRYMFTVCSNIIVYLITWYIFHSQHNDDDTVIGPHDEHKFQLVALAIVVLGVVMSSVFHVGVREETCDTDGRRQLAQHSVSNRAPIFRRSEICKVACVYVATRLFVNLGQVYIPLYLQSYLVLPSESLAILPLVMYISSFVTSAVIKPLNVVFGRKFAYIYGVVLALGACLWIQIGRDDYYRNYEIYGVVITFGCSSAIMLVTSLGITADLIGTNTDNGAFIYGLMSFADKICNGVAVMVVQALKCTNDCPIYYRNTLGIMCGGAALFGLLSILTIPTTKNSLTDQVSEVNNSREKLMQDGEEGEESEVRSSSE